MNILIDKFPDTVCVNGKDYEVETDFREWIRFTKLVEDEDVPWQIKCRLLLQWYTDGIPDDLEEAIEALGDFLTMRQDGEESDKPMLPQKQVYSFDEDMVWIYSAFREAYGIDLCIGGSFKRCSSDSQTIQKSNSAFCTGTQTSGISRIRTSARE